MANDLDTALRGAPFRVRRALIKEIRKQAERVADAIRAKAPRGKTGKLAEFVKVRRGRHTLELIVTVGGELTSKPVRKGAHEYDYALGVEFGNEHVAAQPFVFPTWREMQASVDDEIRDAVAWAIDESS